MLLIRPPREIVRPGEKVVSRSAIITRAGRRTTGFCDSPGDLNEAGVPDPNIHHPNCRRSTPPQYPRGFRGKLCGKEVCHRVRVINHDCWDNKEYGLSRQNESWYGSLGKSNGMEAERLILTGGVIYHYMTGYGGGRKSVLPGLSSITTIRGNHLRGMGPTLGSGSNLGRLGKYPGK